MRWDLRVVYIPGKYLGGRDTLSWYGVRDNNDETVNWMSEIAKNMAEVDSIAPWSDDTLFPPDRLPATCHPEGRPVPDHHRQGAHHVDDHDREGFPETKAELEQEILPYLRVKDMLTVYEGVIYMGDRVVVPEELRSRTLDALNAAHQRTTSMRLRAERNLFWPNVAMDIASKRMSRISCNATNDTYNPNTSAPISSPCRDTASVWW
jgi:hypothetical protein